MLYNIQSLDKKYSDEVPKFLHTRPKKFVDHCLARLPINQEDVEVIQSEEVASKKFMVKSHRSGNLYHVDLGKHLPSCTCPDWMSTHWPCKHMLHIMLNVPGHGWNSLCEEFTNAPHLCVDIDILDEISMDESFQETMSPSTPPDVPLPKKKILISKNVPKTVAVASRC